MLGQHAKKPSADPCARGILIAINNLYKNNGAPEYEAAPEFLNKALIPSTNSRQKTFHLVVFGALSYSTKLQHQL